MRHPATANVVIGVKSAEQVRQNVEWFETEIPQDLWSTLEAKGLIAAV